MHLYINQQVGVDYYKILFLATVAQSDIIIKVVSYSFFFTKVPHLIAFVFLLSFPFLICLRKCSLLLSPYYTVSCCLSVVTVFAVFSHLVLKLTRVPPSTLTSMVKFPRILFLSWLHGITHVCQRSQILKQLVKPTSPGIFSFYPKYVFFSNFFCWSFSL